MYNFINYNFFKEMGGGAYKIKHIIMQGPIYLVLYDLGSFEYIHRHSD